MGWNYDKSLARIATDLERLDADGGVIVEKLVRAMDLDNLTDKRCREIYGAHVYVTISNFPEYASVPTKDNEYRKFIRSVHVYQRVVHHIVETIFDATFVHFQGPKLHALVYRPIGDATNICNRAMLLQRAIRDFVDLFNDVTAADVAYSVASGADIGDVVGTRNGQVQDRELLFIGGAANAAAKMISTGERLSPQVYEALSDDLKAFCHSTDHDATYRLSMPSADFDALAKTHGINWDRTALRELIKDEEAAVPLSEILYSDANEKINPDSLSIRNNKRVLAASLFADVSGFTKFVDSKTDEEGKAEALRAFQAIRRESSMIARSDYEGVPIQYQGDRIQAIYHLPKADEATIALTALEAAASMQSAMEETLRESLVDVDDIHYAVGIDIGQILVTKLGYHGDRDRVCLGTSVEEAQRLEDAVAGPKEIAASSSVYDALPKYAQERFTKRGSAYVAKDLTLDKLELAKKVEEPMKEVGITKSVAGFAVTSAAQGSRIEVGKHWSVADTKK